MADRMGHEKAAELLPWLANGTLSPDEDAAVREHAASCVTCRRDLDGLERVAGTLRDVRQAQPATAPDMRRINARIDDFLERERHGPAIIVAFRELARNRWRLAFAVQSMVVLIVVAGSWMYLREPVAEYRTLTSVEELPPGHYARMVFEPGLSETAIQELLDAQGMSIARGPSAGGVYTVRFADGTGADERQATLDALQHIPAVRFVQPVADPAGTP